MWKWWDTSKGAWGLLAIGVGVGIVLSYISSPQVGIPVGAAITVIGIILVIRAYRGRTRPKEEPQTLRKEAIKLNLTDTLTAMHRRLIELQKEKEAHTKISFEAFRKVVPTLADRMGTVKREDWAQFKNGIELSIRQAIPPKPRMNIRGRFNFKKWAKLNEEWKERVYSVALSIATREKAKLLNTKDWTLADGMKVAEWVDGYDWGIQKLRDDDPQWKALYESIDNRFRIDSILGDLIKKHIDLSRVYNNVTLLVHYSGQFKDDIYSLMLYEGLVGSPMSPEEVDKGLDEVLREIEKRLNDMNTQPPQSWRY